jgi:hypothetical protein
MSKLLKESLLTEENIMVIETYTPEITALRAEIIPRLQEEVESLLKMKTPTPTYLSNRAGAIEKVINEQRNRLLTVTSDDEVANLLELIRITAEYDKVDSYGTEMAMDIIFSYVEKTAYRVEERQDNYYMTLDEENYRR